MAGKRILIVEQDPDLAVELTVLLRDGGYDPVVAGDGRAGLQAALDEPPALAVIDVLLPGINGLDLCRRLRTDARTAGVPVLLLAGRADAEARTAAVGAGADGCLARASASSDLLRRVQALLMRDGAAAEGVLHYGEVQLDRVRHCVFVGGREARLTLTEFRLLECLLREPGRAFSRRELAEAAVSQEGADERAVDVPIKTLRRKLGLPGLVEAVRGVGYRIGRKS